ncbi:MAG TPA: GNAT family protein [Acidimicrobiia bacterium]|nr:GNAT family protein [Acidimicrobiia bacterium]
MIVLEGLRVVLRRAVEADVDAILDLLQSPGVAEWWPDAAREDVITKTVEGGGDTVGFVIEVEGAFAGFIQYWEEDDTAYRHAGIDVALGAGYRDRGVGTDAVRTMARHLLDDLGHHRVVIDPAAHNARAIRAYEKVGFKRVGVMRRYERGADGTWHDSLLMDLLSDDLTQGRL